MASAVTKLEVPPTYVRPQETPLRETVIGQRQPQTQEAWPLGNVVFPGPTAEERLNLVVYLWVKATRCPDLPRYNGLNWGGPRVSTLCPGETEAWDAGTLAQGLGRCKGAGLGPGLRAHIMTSPFPPSQILCLKSCRRPSVSSASLWKKL